MTERVRYPLIITLICLAASAALALTFAVTKDRIAESKQKELGEGLKKVLPENQSIGETTLADGGVVYTAYSGADESGSPVGYAAVGEAQGYSSRIEVLVGVRPDLEVVAISILKMQETPGLGERARERPATRTIWGAIGDLFRGDGGPGEEPEPAFQKQFRGKTPDELELTDKQGAEHAISQLTGATITSRAVVTATERAIDRIRTHLGRQES
ncbi:MAG: RnfABCDGE type electron transport complex subunit G [Planctomycetota bacterium]